MSSFCVWTVVVILYQTIICVVFSWLTLECSFAPHSKEPRQLTLIKLLYLYEPQACGRQYFYNHTTTYKQTVWFSTIVWPENNHIATAFRNKVKLSLCLHLAWLGLALLNASQGRRECGFYAVLLPLTATGVAILVVDLVHAALFLRDASFTTTESAILEYIGSGSVLRRIKKKAPYDEQLQPFIINDDTTWIALMFAYLSCRGVVQWIVNFWIVQDTYFKGLEVYRYLSPTRRGVKK
ncbi:uncharacterized protein [Choristoneura fumiferana]|uniref:uncharacterized protein n=1 Tax=Choristoneura fumiferana TaxID=7141 RepID=UPI003D1569EA